MLPTRRKNGSFDQAKGDQNSFTGSSSSSSSSAQPRMGNSTSEGDPKTLKDSKWARGNSNGYQQHNPASTWGDVALAQNPTDRLAMPFNNGRGGYSGEFNGGDHRQPWCRHRTSGTQGGVSQKSYAPN